MHRRDDRGGDLFGIAVNRLGRSIPSVMSLARCIEIRSPGGLYGMASPENFPTQTDYRNPVIAEAMASLGYGNRFGRGVLRAREALHRNGNPEAQFRLDPSFVLATSPGKR